MGREEVNIANRLRLLRAEEGITQAELAKAVRVTRVTISCIERGEYHPSLALALKLARFFSKPVEEIFLLEEES